ncbi:MAG: enoyl-CoA hydratase/isomerase family protein [Myxococcaceae bacterium]|nr:enoyl-CoA hydratase/isomerase family protein [Myxococcaceae bacterium]
MGGAVHVEDAGGGVRLVTLSNPGRKNALDGGMLDALARAFDPAPGVRAFLVTGAGEGVFSAGWDLNTLSRPSPGERLPDALLSVVLDRMAAHPAPCVAAIDGPAFGAACELAIACDLRVGSPGAVFSMPPARLGVVYSLEGLGRFRARLGDATTRSLFLSGRRVGAAEALRRQLLDDVVERPRDVALAWCRELAANAPLAMQGLKHGLELLSRGAVSVEERAAYEALRRRSFESEDADEGRRAILEKRAPTFQGR